MAMPSSAVVRYDLSAPVSEFDLEANRRGFIGPQVLRPRVVGLQAANLGKIPLAQLLQEQKTTRAPGAGYSRGDFEFSNFSYATDEHGWEEPMDDRNLAIFRDMLDAEDIHSKRAINMVLQRYEIDVAAALYNTTTWTGSSLTTGISNEWDDWSNAVPITDVLAAKEKVIAGCGLEPNALILNRYQFDNLCNCAQIVDRIKYAREATAAQVAPLVAGALGLERLIVAGGLTNTANPQQTMAISRIWSNEYMMVARVATGDDPTEPCLGRTFIWSGDGPGAPGTNEEFAVIVEQYREESVRGQVIRARNDRDLVVMYATAAHLLSNAITI